MSKAYAAGSNTRDAIDNAAVKTRDTAKAGVAAVGQFFAGLLRKPTAPVSPKRRAK